MVSDDISGYIGSELSWILGHLLLCGGHPLPPLALELCLGTLKESYNLDVKFLGYNNAHLQLYYIFSKQSPKTLCQFTLPLSIYTSSIYTVPALGIVSPKFLIQSER